MKDKNSNMEFLNQFSFMFRNANIAYYHYHHDYDAFVLHTRHISLDNLNMTIIEVLQTFTTASILQYKCMYLLPEGYI